MKIQDIKTFEDACNVCELDPQKAIPDLSYYPEKLANAFIAQLKLMIIIQALNVVDNNNENWTPDFDDHSEKKFFPVFEMKNSLFAYDYSTYWPKSMSLGRPFVFKTETAAIYAGNQFTEIYADNAMIDFESNGLSDDELSKIQGGRHIFICYGTQKGKCKADGIGGEHERP